MSNIESNFVPYQIALDMKELGFDEPCLGFWSSKNSYRRFINDSSTNIDLKNMFGEKATEAPTAPLYQQCFKWFREKYKLHNIVDFNSSKNSMWYYSTLNIEHNISETCKECFKTYEEAELECLKKLIELCKKH